MKSTLKITVLLMLLATCISFSPYRSHSQSKRMGIDVFAGYSHPPKIDSFTFTHSDGESYKVMKDSRGLGFEYGFGLVYKYGYQRHFFTIEPTLRFYDHEYILNVDSISMWDPSDSIKFGVSRTHIGVRLLYDYKFRFLKQNLSFSLGGNYILTSLKEEQTQTIKAGSGTDDLDIKYSGLSYKLPDLFEENSHFYALAGLNWDLMPAFTIGAYWKQRLTQLTENAPLFFYGVHITYTLALKKPEKHIFIDPFIKQ